MEEIYTYLGYAIIAVLIYLILKTIFVKKQAEGFMGVFEGTDETKEDEDETEDPDAKLIEKNVTNIEAQTNKTIKQMNLVKNRKHWEKLIVAMEDRINSVSLQSMAIMASMLNKNPNDEKLIKVIERLNSFNTYKQTLKDNMTYLDGLE